MDPNKLASLLVHGFARDLDQGHSEHDMNVIYDLIQTFHLVVDQWDTNTSDEEFLIQNKHLKLSQNVGTYANFCNAFGKQRIKIGQKKEWKIKICEFDHEFWTKIPSVSIGIIDASQNEDNLCGGGYSYIATNGWIKHHSIKDSIKVYGRVAKQNDIISMELDMRSKSNCTLKY